MDYRKPSKPRPKPPSGWPWSEPKPYVPSRPHALDHELEELSGQYERKNRFMDNVNDIFKIGLLILFIVACFGVLYGASLHDNEARRECVESGGRVVVIHNARSVNFNEPWTCER